MSLTRFVVPTPRHMEGRRVGEALQCRAAAVVLLGRLVRGGCHGCVDVCLVVMRLDSVEMQERLYVIMRVLTVLLTSTPLQFETMERVCVSAYQLPLLMAVMLKTSDMTLTDGWR